MAALFLIAENCIKLLKVASTRSMYLLSDRGAGAKPLVLVGTVVEIMDFLLSKKISRAFPTTGYFG